MNGRRARGPSVARTPDGCRLWAGRFRAKGDIEPRSQTERSVPMRSSLIREFGRVGMTERAAREAGRRVKTARFDMRRNGKAVEIGETAGFIKVMVDAETDRLLGAAVLAHEGAELVHTYIDLMNAGVLVGQKALVTGANSGIGEAAAIALGQ